GVFVELHRQRRQIERQSALLREIEARELRARGEHAERALRDSELVYEHTFESAPVGIGHARLDGRITRENERLRAILGDDDGDGADLHGLVDDGALVAAALAR